eukprot:COSAG06_NODE_828_length_12054_cov_67.028440_5_plen_117_part_00
MVKKAMADDAGGTGSKLAMAMVEHSFAAMGDEIAWKWQRGTMVQLRNGQKNGTVFVPTCHRKTIGLPRRARDKHRESTHNRNAVVVPAGLWAPVFSEEELKARLSDGAFLPDCVQG